MNLYKILEQKTLMYSKHKAIIFDKTKISYNVLKERVDSFAHFLFWKQKIRKGDKVALLLKNCPEFIISYFAILKIGAIVVPLNVFLHKEEIIYILNDSRSIFLISSRKDFGELLIKVQPAINNLRDMFFIDDFCIDKIEVTVPSEDTYSTEVAAILYTSGTTGYPKGVMLTHENFIANINSCVEAVKVKTSDNFLCFLPMFHSFAWTVCVLIPLYVGASITVIADIRPINKFFMTIFKKRVTVFVAIPAIYNILVKLPFISIFSFLLPMRICISGADALSCEVINKFEKKFRRPLLEGYGLTEASPVVSFNPIDGIRKPGTVGLPLPGIKVKVIDENGQILPADAKGQLLVQGENVMKGYFKLPTATAETIIDGWLHTGDMACIDRDGYIKIVGRKKELIISKGLNIYPKEIELVLESHPYIKESAVIGILTKTKGEVPKAYVVLEKDSSISKSDIIKYCRKRLANYKIPYKIDFVKELPKTATGKIQKNKLKT